MTELGVLQEGRIRRSAREAQRRRARRRRQIRHGLLVLGFGLVALLAFMASGISDSGPNSTTTAGTPTKPAPTHPGYVLRTAAHTLPVRLKPPPAAGLVFEVRTGRVIWVRETTRALPIASLTKMMTALVVVEHSKPDDKVMITRAATHFTGSGVGMLPLGKRVPLEDLLYGLLLPSGNDAAIALAQHVAGNQANFVSMMNSRAKEMGLRCSHFTSVSGLVDQGNYSCADDLAVLAHAVLEQPRLARIVATRSTNFPFPIKHKKLFLYNNNPLIYMRYPGVDGVKTGYTTLAGSCLVAAAKRGHKWFGVVLLHSPNSGGQAQKLLDAAFASRT
jgi:D-alanyl-D-alanine carboxypeptidase (penicillin-binding protein 5/6)